MDEGTDSGKYPQRPKLGLRPVLEEPPKEEERIGEVYYRVHAQQQHAAAQHPPPRRHASFGGRGMLLLLGLAVFGLYCYWHPDAVSSAISSAKQWVLSLREEVFAEGKGYGQIPAETH